MLDDEMGQAPGEHVFAARSHVRLAWRSGLEGTRAVKDVVPIDGRDGRYVGRLTGADEAHGERERYNRGLFSVSLAGWP
jgi:hypothetical protein